MAIRSGVPRREPCAKCGNPVYIAERLTVGKSLYHRTCFRCARCNSQLTLANCYETETPNQFCCETCPDEESTTAGSVAVGNKDKPDENSMLSRSLSDEEKSAGLKKLTDRQQEEQDEYSENFETALEYSSVPRASMLGSSEYSKARSQFLTANLVDSASDTEVPPELPKTKPPDIKHVRNSPETSPTMLSSGRRERQSNFSEKSVNKTESESKDVSGRLYLSTRSSNLNAKTSNSGNSNINNNHSESRTTIFSSVNQLSATNSETPKSKYDVTKDKAQAQNENNVRKDNDIVPSLVKNRMKMFEKSTESKEDKLDQLAKPSKSPSVDKKRLDFTKSTENLKRPLTDSTVTSPEKKFSLEKNSAFLKLTRNYESNKFADSKEKPATISNTPKKLDVAQSQAKSLNFLLQKQIALKEGKISPKALFNETKGESSARAESAEDLASNNKTNAVNNNNNAKLEKRKSLEDLVIKTEINANKPTAMLRKRTSDELAKSLLSSSRKSNIEDKNSSSTRRIGITSDRLSSSLRSLAAAKASNTSHKSDIKQVTPITLAKLSPNRDRPSSLNQNNSDAIIANPYRLKKQQSMEEIPKTKLEMNRSLFNRQWKDGRKENLFQAKYKSNEKLENNAADKLSISDYGMKKKTEADYTTAMKHASSESLSGAVRHPGDSHITTSLIGSTGKLDYNEYRRDRSRVNMFMSDTELNNILKRKEKSWSTASPKRKSMDYLPMKSIENLYRSNSEENIAYRSEQGYLESRHLQYEPRRNSVSALKNKFECVSVVESRPSNQTNRTRTTDTDIQNNSVSEIQSEESHGEILRDGHIMTLAETEMEGREETSIIENVEDMSERRSETDESSGVIIIDLTKDASPIREKPDDIPPQNQINITISDDSVIEISDSLSMSQTQLSEKLDVSALEDEQEKKADSGEYPEDLNPFGDDDGDEGNQVDAIAKSKSKSMDNSLNPFENIEDDNGDDEESKVDKKPTPKVRKKIHPIVEKSFHEGDTPEYVRHVYIKRISTNPFEDDEDEDDDHHHRIDKKPTPAVRRKIIVPHEEGTSEDVRNEERIGLNPFEDEDEDDIGVNEEGGDPPPQKKLISAPKISLNPFWSDADEDEPEYDDDDENRPRPVPKPRKSRNVGANETIPEPKPRTSNQSALGISFGSNSSLSSGQSGGQSVRKKKPAPRPPILVDEAKTESPPESSLTSSPSTSVSHSPRLPTKARKTKKAPLPPSSTPQICKNIQESFLPDVSPIPNSPPQSNTDAIKDEDKALQEEDVKPGDHNEEWNNEKVVKDKVNENRRSQLFNTAALALPGNNDYQDYIPNKSTYGKWKRKKGPAPSRPVPQRRMIKALPVSEFRKELDLIELQKQGLEKQGVRLEQIIRDRCEGPDRDDVGTDGEDSVPIDVEDLILQLFEVVNEKNELSRREAELMYLQRQQRLEEEHAEVEYQIRCLMMQPEVNKTDSDKEREEELIQRLVEIVERRNEIIECLEMDRLREAEEDDSISTSLNSYALRRDEQLTAANPAHNTVSKVIEEENKSEETISKKEKSKKAKKDKKSKLKKSNVLDADKDVDESETSIVSVKEKKKKKFALF